MASACPQSQISMLIASIARTLVDCPNRVSVKEIVGTTGSIIRLKVASQDIDNLVGNAHRSEKWLCKILSEIGVKRSLRYSLEIVGSSDVDRESGEMTSDFVEIDRRA
jgi:uncharacterized protein